jgi:uncharacterized protein (DUF433 family)
MKLPDFLELDSSRQVRLTGHRIRLIEVAARYREGHSVESIILDHYPTLNLALVHKVVAFYLENEAEVDSLIAHNEAEMKRLQRQPRTTPSLRELRKRMKRLHGAKAP